jgi:hypothetical protein
LFVYRSHYSDQTDQSRLKDVLGSPRTLHRQQTIAEIQAAESRTKEPRQPGLTLRSAVAAVIRPVDKVPLISIDVANDGNSNPPGAAHHQGRKGAKTAMGKILGFQAPRAGLVIGRQEAWTMVGEGSQACGRCSQG